MKAAAAQLNVSPAEAHLSKRIKKKRIASLHRMVAEALRLYAVRPRSGSDAEAITALALDLLKLDIGLALALLHQWYPSARRGAWVAEVSRPDIQQLPTGGLSASGVVTFSSTLDDSPVAKGEYRLLSSRIGESLRIDSLRVSGPAGRVSPAAV